jgi:arabinan endo-1,5-alpha-L-arabinosidase
VYHQRFDVKSEMHEPRVHQLFRTGNNWLTVCPFATDGEMLCPKDYHESEVAGTFYVVEHGLDISSEMHKALRVEFTRRGEILRYIDQSAYWERESREKVHDGALVQNPDSHGDPEDLRTEDEPYGSYTLKEDSRIVFSLNGVSYEGVIVQLNDEAGNPTMCITGVGANQSAWAVKYI